MLIADQSCLMHHYGALDRDLLKGLIDAWAYQHFDPSLDDYSIMKRWEEMSDSTAKDELKEKIMKNPTLKNILEWEGNLMLKLLI